MRKTKSFRDMFSEVASDEHLLVDGATVKCTTLRVSRSLSDLPSASSHHPVFTLLVRYQMNLKTRNKETVMTCAAFVSWCVLIATPTDEAVARVQMHVASSIVLREAGFNGLEASFEDIDSTSAQRILSAYSSRHSHDQIHVVSHGAKDDQREEREDGREVEDVFARRSTGQDSTKQHCRYPGAKALSISIPYENPQLTKAVHGDNDAGTCVTPQPAPLLSPTSFLSPYTSHLLDSMACKLMSPCISVKSEDRNLCARLATIEGDEGIWIHLRLKHSMQTLLDSCGNGKLSWLRVAIRLDLANALGVNPRHLNIISLEENPDNFTIIQMLLNQPPNSDASALSLASVGERLHRQAHSYLRNTRSSDLSTSIANSMDGRILQLSRSGAELSDEAPTTQKRSLGCKLASGLELKNRKQVINLLQLIESVEVTIARSVPCTSSNWPFVVKTALLLLLLASTTYLAAAFDMLSTPVFRDSSASSSRVGFKSAAPATHISRSSQRMGSRDGYVTQLRMLDPMTTGDLN